MLHHHNATPVPPRRTVLLGAGGFIGGAIVRKVDTSGAAVVGLGRKEVDLVADGAGTRLAALLRADDALVVVAARAPCKTPAMMLENIRMIASVCEALAKQSVAHLAYVSSDAVYADGPLPLTEASPAAPTSLHGAMHLAREQMLLAAAGATPLAIVRPTLVYGAGDPHNGYGPNKFRRQANRGEAIVLFGEGEERRDHVDIDDIAELVGLVLKHRSAGVLNIATGTVASFRALADKAVSLSPRKVEIKGSPRNGPMPHNGYRPFDPAATRNAFPDFRYTAIDAGLARAQHKEFG
jgi:nucleoside-diphosphate-sugar epimerase